MGYPNIKLMSEDNYFVYCCAWCVICADEAPYGRLHDIEYGIAVRGGIVFW